MMIINNNNNKAAAGHETSGYVSIAAVYDGRSQSINQSITSCALTLYQIPRYVWTKGTRELCLLFFYARRTRR